MRFGTERDWTSLIGGRDSIAHEDQVIEWVEKMLIRRMSRDKIIAASKEGTDGWPGRRNGTPREPLSPTRLFAIRAVIAYKERVASGGANRQAKILKSQIANYRRMEKEAGFTSRAHFIQERQKIVELAYHARRIRPMVYWSKDSAPDDEMERIYDEALGAFDALRLLIGAVDTQRGDKQLRDKIKALRAKADSTRQLGNAEEADAFYRKAAELEDRL
jgi:hypothetical protein